MRAEDERHTAALRDKAQGHRGTAAVHVERQLSRVAQGHDFLHVLLGTGMHHDVGHLADLPFTQVRGFLHGLAAAEPEPAVIVDCDVVIAHDRLELPDVGAADPHLSAQGNLPEPLLFPGRKVIVGHAELLLHHAVPGVARVLEPVRGAPLEN